MNTVFVRSFHGIHTNEQNRLSLKEPQCMQTLLSCVHQFPEMVKIHEGMASQIEDVNDLRKDTGRYDESVRCSRHHKRQAVQGPVSNSSDAGSSSPEPSI